jgi:hypothetical protein
MTSKLAAAIYLVEHLRSILDKEIAVFNPHDLPHAELPVIYGFSNGGTQDHLQAVAIAQDGTVLGTHLCSHEGYMPHDLGIMEGTSPLRHERDYKPHYPRGYRMDFVPRTVVKDHAQLCAALAIAEARHQADQHKKLVSGT